MLVDGSNVGHAAAAAPKLSVGEIETHAVLGFLRTLRGACARFPNLAPVVLWDGRSWRKDLSSTYKGSRDDKPTTANEEKLAEVRASFKAQRPLIMKALATIGVAQMVAANLEADDLAGMLVTRYAAQGHNILMVSGDKDWITLVRPKVGWMNPVPSNGSHKTVTAMNFEKEMGVKNGRAWLEVKALAGDPSDEIPGVGGIGEKGAKDLINAYGSVVDFLNASITEKKLPKKYQALADDVAKQTIFHNNLKLMDLQHKEIPAPVGLRVVKKPADIEALKALCRELLFQSILTDPEMWLEPFRTAA